MSENQTEENLCPRCRRRFPRRKALISVFIVFCLWAQIKPNLKLEFPYGVNFNAMQTWAESDFSRKFYYDVYFYSYYADWAVSHLAWLAGLTTTWRMFSPPPMSNWHYEITAVFNDGTEVQLKLPDAGKRSFRQRNFYDFRQVKYYLNIYNKPEALNLLAQHYCYKRLSIGEPVEKIRIVLVSTATKSPAEAKETGSAFGDVYRTPFGEFVCAVPGDVL